MSIPVFECVTLVASNDTTNGGVSTVSCTSEPIAINESECLSIQLTVGSIWGAGTALPKLDLATEFSSNGVNFGGPTDVIADVTAAGTTIASPTACGGFVRLVATFTLDTVGTSGPGAATFGAWLTLGDDGA